VPALSQGKRSMMGCEPCSRGRIKAIAGCLAPHDSSSWLWEKNCGYALQCRAIREVAYAPRKHFSTDAKHLVRSCMIVFV